MLKSKVVYLAFELLINRAKIFDAQVPCSTFLGNIPISKASSSYPSSYDRNSQLFEVI